MNKNSIKDIFEKENLIIPDYNNLNIVDLLQTIYSRYGLKFDNKRIDYLNKVIPNKKHTLFILIDGMGSNLINSLNDNSILKKNKVEDIITVCPTSTGCVLTTLATAKYPSEHGILGWYNYNRKFNIDYLPLLFCDRKNEKDLSEYNINPDDIYKPKSLLNDLNCETTVLFPERIINSQYSKFVAHDNIRVGYTKVEDAFDKILNITNSDSETFTYLYISNIDSLEHDYGVHSNEVLNEIKKIENCLQKICNINDLVTIITADHGQTNVEEDIILDFSKYDKYFYAYPSIDFGTAMYYIKKEYEEEFVKEFNSDYKNKMYLFKTSEFIDNNVFGINITNNIIDSLGEYISICKSKYCFINSTNINEYIGITKGNHSGFSKDELNIPLIII